MKSKSLRIIYLFSLIVFFSACKPKKIENVQLNLIFTGPIAVLEEEEQLPLMYANLISYYKDTVTNDRIFVPDVKIERIDINSNNKENYEIPLSGLNKFRKKMDLLSAAHIIQDFDKNINKLEIPSLILKKKGNNKYNIENPIYKNAIKIDLPLFNDSISKMVQNSIKDKLNSGKANGKIDLIFYEGYPPPPPPKDSCYSYDGANQNGIPNGAGIMTVLCDTIFENDINKQIVRMGSVLKGTWRNGQLQTARVYDSKGEYKFTLIIGSD